MKWPKELVVVRHAQSEYNILRNKKMVDPLYIRFKREYEANHRSAEAQSLAYKVQEKYSLGVSDYGTRITQHGVDMSYQTGLELRTRTELPDVILVSPYVRTRDTLSNMKQGWTELGTVKTVVEDRIREQEHGLSIAYNDWRVFHVMHPEQKTLRELQGPYWYQYPQGESVSQVRDRIRSLVDTLIREYSGHRVMLVTHHLTILSIRAILERLSPEEFIHLDEFDKPVNCGVTIYNGKPKLGRDGKLVLQTYNEKLY